MNKEQQGIALKGAGIALIVSFFLNWMSMLGHSISALSMVCSDDQPQMNFLCKLCLILIPVSGGTILYFNIVQKGAYPFSQKILFCIPAGAVVLFYLFVSSKISDLQEMSYGFGSRISANDVLAMGFWLALLASGLLVFLAFQKEKSTIVTGAEKAPPAPTSDTE